MRTYSRRLAQRLTAAPTGKPARPSGGGGNGYFLGSVAAPHRCTCAITTPTGRRMTNRNTNDQPPRPRSGSGKQHGTHARPCLRNPQRTRRVLRALEDLLGCLRRGDARRLRLLTVLADPVGPVVGRDLGARGAVVGGVPAPLHHAALSLLNPLRRRQARGLRDEGVD